LSFLSPPVSFLHQKDRGSFIWIQSSNPFSPSTACPPLVWSSGRRFPLARPSPDDAPPDFWRLFLEGWLQAFFSFPPLLSFTWKNIFHTSTLLVVQPVFVGFLGLDLWGFFGFSHNVFGFPQGPCEKAALFRGWLFPIFSSWPGAFGSQNHILLGRIRLVSKPETSGGGLSLWQLVGGHCATRSPLTTWAAPTSLPRFYPFTHTAADFSLLVPLPENLLGKGHDQALFGRPPFYHIILPQPEDPPFPSSWNPTSFFR